MFKELQRGDVRVADSLMPTVSLQISQFNPIKTNNVDDILDLLAYANKAIELYGEYMISIGDIIQQEYADAKVVEFNSCF